MLPSRYRTRRACSLIFSNRFIKPHSIIFYMSKLKFYDKEEELFKEAYQKKLCERDSKIVFTKLKRHYGLTGLKLFCNRKKGGWFSVGKGVCSISISKNTTFGVLCHEIGHALDLAVRGKSQHDKELMSAINRVVNYCKRNDWWQKERKVIASKKVNFLR